MIEFKTDKVLGNDLEIHLSDDGLIEEVYLDGWALDLTDVKFKDPKHPDGTAYVDLQTLLYDEISEALVTRNTERRNYDHGCAVRARRES